MAKNSIYIFLIIFLSNGLLFNFSYAQKNNIQIEHEKNIWIVKHDSEVLKKENLFRIFIPKKSDKDSLFPVLYVLHGVLCHSDAWIDQTQIEDIAENYRMILVFPDAYNSWYLDSPIKPDMQYETYIIKELIPLVEKVFPAKSGKHSRAIMGASMGGHGAITLAEKYPGLFCSTSSFFGILKLTDKSSIESNLVGPFLTDLLGPYNSNRKRWRANSAYELAKNFLNKNIDIFIDWGTSDVTPAKENNIKFHKRLTKLRIPHIYKERYGGHTSDFLNTHIQEHLDFHWECFSRKHN